MSIQADARRVARAIAAALQVEVTISDEEYHLVASSSDYLKHKGSNLYSLFKARLFQTGQTIVVREPGRHAFCRGCKWEGHCPEKAIILKPIVHQGRVLGDIGVSSFTLEQQERILHNTKALESFLAQMGELLTVKLSEKATHDKLEQLVQQLNLTMDFAGEGLLSTDAAGRITHCNAQAASVIGRTAETLLGEPLTSLLPGDVVTAALDRSEAISNLELPPADGREARWLVSLKPMPTKLEGRVTGLLVAIRDVADVNQLLYRFGDRPEFCSFDDIIGQSAALQQVKKKAACVAASSSTVLLTGETGTGKELFARAIHAASPRRDYPFVTVNCAAIPDTLLESELFGYEHGAFTGARKGGKPGKFELANKGTIFLDEVGELPLHLQAKLLRVLEARRVERLGGLRPVTLDVRVIAATNRNLQDLVHQGQFRDDLYYRLNVIPLVIPPLRDRPEDVITLARFFLAKFARLLGKHITGFAPEVEELFRHHPWPGNVRELENAVEYAVNVTQGSTITLGSIPEGISQKWETGQAALPMPEAPFLSRSRQELERRAIVAALAKHGSTVEGKQHAAQELGISRSTLYRKIKQLGIVVSHG